MLVADFAEVTWDQTCGHFGLDKRWHFEKVRCLRACDHPDFEVPSWCDAHANLERLAQSDAIFHGVSLSS